MTTKDHNEWKEDKKVYISVFPEIKAKLLFGHSDCSILKLNISLERNKEMMKKPDFLPVDTKSSGSKINWKILGQILSKMGVVILITGL